jgi:hypothetical protein
MNDENVVENVFFCLARVFHRDWRRRGGGGGDLATGGGGEGEKSNWEALCKSMHEVQLAQESMHQRRGCNTAYLLASLP